MTYDQLKILDKIVETGSFMAAAEALYRTQPAVSIAMKKLEEEFGLNIFDREQYRATLTPEGHRLYQKAKTVLYHSEALEILGKQLAMGNEIEIKISIDIVCPLPLILGILRQFQDRHPLTKINLMAESMGGTFERLMEGNADLAILPWLPHLEKIETIDFTCINGGPVAAPNFPPARIKRQLSTEEMKEFVQVVVRDSSRNSEKLTRSVIEGGRQCSVSDFFTKKQIILAEMGWGGLPYHLIEDELQNGALVTLDVQNLKAWEGKIKVARRTDKPMGPVVMQLWEQFQHHASR